MLLLHRHLPHAELVAALRLVVAVGGTTADVVAVEARKFARLNPSSNPDGGRGQLLAPVGRRVVSLTERRLADPAAVIAGLPPDARPLPTVDAYDELLHRRASPAAAAAGPAHRGAVS